MSGYTFHTDPDIVELNPVGDRHYSVDAAVGTGTRTESEPSAVVLVIGGVEVVLTQDDAVELGRALERAGGTTGNAPRAHRSTVDPLDALTYVVVRGRDELDYAAERIGFCGDNHTDVTSFLEAMHDGLGKVLRMFDPSDQRQLPGRRPVQYSDGSRVFFDVTTGPGRYERRWNRPPGMLPQSTVGADGQPS